MNLTSWEKNILINLLESTIKEYEFNTPWEYQEIMDKIKTSKKTKMYIDDIRNPKTGGFIIVRSSESAIEFMENNGCPDYISFDHDLGDIDTAMLVVKYMVEKDLDNDGTFIPKDFEFNVHSANPVGAANIEGYLNCYLRTRKNNK
jgi:hypothetical protein